MIWLDDCYSESSLSESSQTTTKFDVKDMKMFGSMPMEEETIVVKCNNCKRPFLPSRFKEHAGKLRWMMFNIY